MTKNTNTYRKVSFVKRLAKFFGCAMPEPEDAVHEPPFIYVGRLNCDEISSFLAKSLGRRLTQVERAVLDESYRPQGLLGPDDCYNFRLASPHYLGAFAPEIEIFGTAVDGYASGEPQLKLAETCSVHFDSGIDVIDEELVAAF